MKKVIKLALLGLGLFLIHEKVSLASTTFELQEDPNNLTYKIERTDKTVRLYFYHVKDKITKELVYCLEPGVQLSDTEYQELEEWEYQKLNLTEEQKEYINKVAYYGYYYEGHENLNYYYAAQLLIWEKIIPNNWRIYYTDTLGGNKVEWFTNERNEILRLIKEDESLPSFANKTFTWNGKDTLSLTDHNNKLREYELTKKDVDVKQENNTLLVNSKENKTTTLEFTKTYKGAPLKFYLRQDGQNVMRTGKLPNKVFHVNLTSYFLEIEVQKQDEKKSPLPNAKFKLFAKENITDHNGTIIYKKGDLISEKITDKNGKIIWSYLPDGTYLLKESMAPAGYELKNDEYKIKLDKKSKRKTLSIENRLKTATLLITKIDEEKKELKGIVFQIKNAKDELVFEGETNEHGKIKLENLPLGVYKITEIKTKEGYELEKEPILVNLEEQNEIKMITITNKKKKESISIIKIDAETSETLKNVHFQIYNEKEELIFDGLTNESGMIVLNNLPLGTYKIVEIETILGYELEKNPIYFTLDGKEKEITITLTNQKIENVPNTSEFHYLRNWEIYDEERKKKYEKNRI